MQREQIWLFFKANQYLTGLPLCKWWMLPFLTPVHGRVGCHSWGLVGDTKLLNSHPQVADAVYQVRRSSTCWYKEKISKGFCTIYGHGNMTRTILPFYWGSTWTFWNGTVVLRRCLKRVDDGRTDNGDCLYYKLTYEPKGSGTHTQGLRDGK